MHVLILPSGYSDPGHPRRAIFVAEQADALRRSGLHVGVAYVECRRLHSFHPRQLVESHFQTEFQVENDLPTLRMRGWNPAPQYTVGGLIWAAFCRRLVKSYVARQGRPDLIHAHCGLWAGVVASRIREELGIPYVVTEHWTWILRGAVPRTSAGYLRRAYTRADSVIAVSSALAEAARSYAPESQPVVIPNVVDTDFFVPPPEPRSSVPFRFVAVGGLTPRKGFDVLIRAFASAFGRDEGAMLHIGGGGAERGALESLIDALGLTGRVRLLGELTREQVRTAMWEANAFVCASHHETFGVVLIEALSTGIPVVSTRCGGPEEIVDPEVGLLVDRGDVAQLAAALQRIREEHPYSADRLREFARVRYGRDTITTAIQGVYDSVLRSRRIA